MKPPQRWFSAVLMLTGSSFAELNVDSGFLVLQAGHLTSAGTVQVAPAATLKIVPPAHLSADLLQIQQNAMVEGGGTINADLLNQGELLFNTGTDSTLDGSITNSGAVRVVNNSGLQQLPGVFVNSGLVDRITAGYFNINYDFLNSTGQYVEEPEPMNLSMASNSVSFFAPAHHRYRLYESPSLTDPDWIENSSQLGTDGMIEFFPIPPLGSESSGFFRYTVED